MKTVIVLGMHRSATSLLAKGLNNEIYMGDQVRDFFAKGKNNPKGYFENWEFVNLNDNILHKAGGSWHNPPTVERIRFAAEHYKDKISELVHKTSEAAWRNGHNIWGWKDPRTALTVRVFLPYIENPHFVAVFRNPERVAASLNKAYNMPTAEGFALAKIYNDRILEFLSEWNTQQKRLK